MWGHGGAHGHPLSFPLGPLMFLSLSCASCQLPPCLLRLCERSGWVRVEHSPNEGRIDNFLFEIYHWRFPRAPISSVQFPKPATAAQAKAPVSTSALWTQYFPVDKKQEAPAVDIGSSDTGCGVTDPGQERWCFHKTALSSRMAPTQHRHGKLVTLPLYLLPVESWLSFLDYTPIYIYNIIQLYIINIHNIIYIYILCNPYSRHSHQTKQIYLPIVRNLCRIPCMMMGWPHPILI